jgi:uncharacterized protein
MTSFDMTNFAVTKGTSKCVILISSYIAPCNDGLMSPFRARTLSRIDQIAAHDWDACAGAANPFLCHAFLYALEESGSATTATGWQPIHVVVENEHGEIVAVAPCYVKSHSRGEYVFDHPWAEAYERIGGRYYPKLQICVPFTPVTGPRLLIKEGAQSDCACEALIKALLTLPSRYPVSSLHMTFAPPSEGKALAENEGAHGAISRTDLQYHWINDGYTTFDDFLNALTPRKRKMIAKERREALKTGLEIKHITGEAITEAHMDAMYAFYHDTSARKWGSPYLTRAFFSMIRKSMSPEILLIFAYKEGKAIAGAINYIGADTLYGRHWGCLESHPFLHFEVCYYQAIDYALAHGLKGVEAGAQGEHKFTRGYRPILTHSVHLIKHEGLRSAVQAYVGRERTAIEQELEALKGYSSYKE